MVQLKRLKNANIPVYSVPGSHDFNAGGKTILDVLHEAELLKNVMRGQITEEKLVLDFTLDNKTNTKLTGLGGRKGSLEQKEFKTLDLQHLEDEPGDKIFLFHS